MTEPALICPMPDCDYYEWLSEEDPDCTLTQMRYHLTGYFAGQHRLAEADAMRWLAKVQEGQR
jgi:hypothetical protein